MNIKTSIISLLTFLILFSSKAEEKSPIDVKLFAAKGEPQNAIVMMLGGAEGGFIQSDFRLFTQAGYDCVNVAYFRSENTPAMLNMIPLEYFEFVIQHIKSLPNTENKKLVVCGSSKGAELALLLASRYDDIKGVIARAPSSVVFQGIGGAQSSWSQNGKPIPFVPYVDYDFAKVKNYEFLEMYQLTLLNKEAVGQATIPVEKINGPIMLVSGSEDLLWPSSKMSEAIIQRLKDEGFEHSYWHKSYKDAGHTLNEFYQLGGTREGNRIARADYEIRVLEFLKRLSLDQ